MDPWDDPKLKTWYHVQLETRDLIISCEVATPNFDPADIAREHLRSLLPDPDNTHIHVGGCSSIGYVSVDYPSILDFRVTTGNAPFPVDFDGRPVRVVVTHGPNGKFVGTDRLIVSRLQPDGTDV